MTRGAVADGHDHFCPIVEEPMVTALQEPSPHRGGDVKAGGARVLINGHEAATIHDYAPCRKLGSSANLVADGQPDVLVAGEPIARRFERTTHGGMVMEGSHNVWIAPSSYDPIAAGITRLELTPFGRTKRGRRIIERLRRMHEKDMIEIAPFEGHQTVYGWYDTKTEKIHVVNPEVDPSQPIKPDDVANVLAHEAVHAEQHEQDPLFERDSWGIVKEEREAWDTKNEVYKQQKEQGTRPKEDKGLEEYDGLHTTEKDEWLINKYGKEYFRQHGKESEED